MNQRFSRAAFAVFSLVVLPFLAFAQPRTAVSLRAFAASPIDRFDSRFSVGEAAKTARFSGLELTGYSKIFKNTFFAQSLALAKIFEPSQDSYAEKRRNFLTADFAAQHQFFRYGSRLNPFLKAGFGASGDLAGRDWALHLPAALGLNARIAPDFYLNLQAQYRFLGQTKENCQFGAGLVYFFDDKKSAPKVDLELLEKKADGDGDGTPDSRDRCPDVAGKPEFFGCADSDNDGVADNEDKCPRDFGPRDQKGCPEAQPKFVDSDSDGIDDQRDECPDATGLLKFGGCPDSDFDDVPDHLDACAHAAGSAANKGCPTISADDQKALDEAAQSIQFETGQAAILKSSLPAFEKLAEIMARNPTHSLEIGGHTDNVGSESVNVRLSTARAKACFDRLVARGVVPERVGFKGFGSASPVASNLSSEGRQRNRRVEFRMFVR